MPAISSFQPQRTAIYLPARRTGKVAARKLAFDKALHLVVPRLTRRQRHFLASVGGFREAGSFDVAMIELLEAPAWELQGLVRFDDSRWKRHVGRKRQMSSSYRLTDLGRMFVLSAARLIDVAQSGAKIAGVAR